MLEEKDLKTLKDKACNEISKISRRMESMNDIPKADWENLVLALKAYEKALNIEHMEQQGYSGYYMRDNYSNNYSGRRDSMGRYSSSYDDYSGHYDNRVIEDMMRNASPQERQVLERMMGRR